MDREMFKEIKSMLDKYEELAYSERELTKEERDWIDNYELNIAKVLNKELLSCSKIAKLLCVMNDCGEIKIRIE